MAEEIGKRGLGAGEVLDVFGAALAVKGDPAKCGFFLGEHEVPPGYAPPPHVHADEVESFYVLAGELTLIDGAGEERRLGPGEVTQLPAGLPHGFRNDTAAPVRFLVMVHPGAQSLAMFRDFDRAGHEAPAGALAPAEIAAIAARHGVRIG